MPKYVISEFEDCNYHIKHFSSIRDALDYAEENIAGNEVFVGELQDLKLEDFVLDADVRSMLDNLEDSFFGYKDDEVVENFRGHSGYKTLDAKLRILIQDESALSKFKSDFLQLLSKHGIIAQEQVVTNVKRFRSKFSLDTGEDIC